jgi:hypothetical protein
MNAQLTTEVASKFEDPGVPGTFYVKVSGDFSISIEDNSSAGANDVTEAVFGADRSTWNTWLSAVSFAGIATINEAPEKGVYTISALNYSTNQISIQNFDGSSYDFSNTITQYLGHYVRISRKGRQRISSTDMSNQGVDSLGFYYFDVECVSEGYGDQYNIGEDRQGTVTGYYSEGWSIRVEDENLSFSMAEVPWIDITPRLLVAGTSFDETNKREIAGSNIQINYERDVLVERISDYVTDKRNRIVCQSPLARSLFPIFVRTYIAYTGGDEASAIRTSLAELIEEVLPDDQLEVSDMVRIIGNTGAVKVDMPITLVGLSHQKDRTIEAERSKDAISSARLSALLPDDADTPDGASYIILNRRI